MSKNPSIKIVAIVGALAVAIGAFGAHAVRDRLPSMAYDTYQTGALYHYLHVIMMAIIYTLYQIQPSRSLRASFWLFATGILFFSGSLYLLATRSLLEIDWPWLGPITPIGGLLFVAGWASLFFTKITSNKNTSL